MNVERKDHRQPCRYGESCYQKNPMHREKFKHPEKEDDKENLENKKRPLSETSETDELAKKIKTDSVSSTDIFEATTEEDTEDETDGGTQSDTTAETQMEDKKEDMSKEGEEAANSFEDILPPSPEDIRESIKQKFLVDMPEDFYQFYELCKSMNKEDPRMAFAVAGLKLCGPFDVLAGKIPQGAQRSAALFLRHFRYYFDPPEFQTVITQTEDTEDMFHIGYFRDSPTESPVFVASNTIKAGGRILPLADNIFGALYQHLAKKIENCDPFMRSKLVGLQEKIKLYANRMIINGDKYEISLDAKTAGMKLRDRSKVSTLFHGAGLVVPYNKKTEVGYREIPETTASLKKIFTRVVEAEDEDQRNKALDVLQELVTNVQFANDEGDPGMGLELGLNAFSFGGEGLHNTIRHLLGVGYDLLDRDAFATILSAHLDNRVQGPSVDMFKK